MIHRTVKKFFELEASTGILLIIATVAALMIANSDSFFAYQGFFSIDLPLTIDFIGYSKELSIKDWINDGLMVLFFLLVGLELKEEVMVGELSNKSKIMLPVIGAIGGTILPALIYLVFNFNETEALRGFAIPTATDIAFAYGVVCLLGRKVSKPLRIFLISLAVFDDIIAILIIAFFYSHELNLIYSGLAILVIIGLAVFNFIKLNKLIFYLVLGVLLWMVVLQSGIHPTLSGVILAMFIPIKIGKKELLHRLIKRIAPVVNFLILPVFAFANIGVKLVDGLAVIFSSHVTMGIALGLFIGKQIGVMLVSFFAIKFGLCCLPNGTNNKASWLEFYGVAILTGIGFTMSLFVGSLAFKDNIILFEQAKIGVLLGSILSVIFGWLVINFATYSKKLS